MRISPLIALTGLVLLLLGCTTPAPGNIPGLSGGSFGVVASASHAPQTSPDALRVMSFNLRRPFLLDGPNHWRFRRDAVIHTIRSQDPDILSTQECVWAQGQYLHQTLSGYAFVGAGRDDGQRDGEMCAILYKQDRFSLLDHGHFWLSDTPEAPGSKSWGNPWTRMVTWVKLREQDSGRQIALFNTHFSVASANARRKAATLLRQRIATIAADGECSIVVTGDFNDVEPSTPYLTLTQGSTGSTLDDLRDAYRAVNPIPADGEGTRHGFHGSKNGPRIDWVLTSQDLRPDHVAILNQRVDGRYPSDHYPVVANLRWQAPTIVAVQPQPAANQPRTN